MSFEYTVKQKEAWMQYLTNDRYTRILFDGGSRSGKTVLLMEYVFMRALQYPQSRQLIARKHRVHAEKSIWNDTLKKLCARRGGKGTLYRTVDSKLEISFANGSQIFVDGLDDADRVEKILGTEYITVYLNEATQLSWNTTQMLMTRLAQVAEDKHGHPAIPKLLIDCNPRGPQHWLYHVGVKHVDPESEQNGEMKPLADAESWGRVHWSAYDNKANLPAAYLKTLETLPEIMRDRMLHGIWRSAEGLVYGDFDEKIHCVEPFEIPAGWTKVRAIDFGFKNPFVCLWGAVNPDGALYLYREYYVREVLTRDHAEKIKKLSGKEKYLATVADHDAEERAELSELGVTTEAADKRVLIGLQECQKRLKDGRIFFFSNLTKLKYELSSYEWLPPGEGRNAKEEPRKENDHAMDALRYLVMYLNKPTFSKFKQKIKKCGVYDD